jgi:hypothetical protein
MAVNYRGKMFYNIGHWFEPKMNRFKMILLVSRNGYGTTGTKVSGPVHVGDPITLLILMRSQWGQYHKAP